jgi:hypothetical protein
LTGFAFAANVANMRDEFTKRQCLLFVIGLHGMGTGRETAPMSVELPQLPTLVTDGMQPILFYSNSAQQKQDNQNNQKQAQSAARVITPTPAVWPRRKCAKQHKNEYNQ